MSVDVYVDNTVTTRIPRQLIESDIHGKGAAEIGWGTPGDFKRCEKFAKIHGIPAHMRDGFCANLHKLATGEWPGRNAHKGMHALIASAALDYMIAAAAADQSRLIRWEGPLALVEQPTGDRRRFPRDTLTYQTFPMPFRFQRVGLAGHQGAITVGVIEHAAEKDHEGQRVVYGRGYFLDPAIVPEVNEAVHLAEHGVTGPSVDLDSYTAVLKKNALSGETTADMVRGRQRAATLVSVPAFANLRIKIMRPDTALVAAAFAVNSTGWHGAPIAPREALFDADDAAKRIEGWANGDPKKMASMFLWIADSANAPLIGRKGYRLPWGDIVDGKPFLIYHAVYAAAALLEGAHGGLPAVPDEEKAKLRTVISSIYEDLAAEYNDPSIIAPWDRQAQEQQASGEVAWIDADGDEYACYVSSYTAALEEFVRHHRYKEALHPRDPRKDDHAGEWIDTPHGPHGQIKVGGKWVYPPKRGEKGYKNPEKAARGIAKRGGGKPGGKSETHVAPKAHKAAPRKSGDAEKRRISRQADKEVRSRMQRSAKAKANGPHNDRKEMDHEDALRKGGMTRDSQKRYLEGLSDDEIDTLVKKVGGQRFDDDTRDDLETEIIRRVNKPRADEEEDKQRRKDEETKRKDRELRELDHGNKRKTTIGKKEPGPGPEEKKKPEPEPKKPEKKSAQEHAKAIGELRNRDAANKYIDDNELTNAELREIIKIQGKKPPSGASRDQLKELAGRGARMRGYQDVIDDTFKREKPKDKDAPEPKKQGTTVAKKEHKLTPAQQTALENVRDHGQQAKIHASTRKVLEREGYLNVQGNLTEKGRKHVGGKDKTPEPHKPEPKKPEPEAPKKPTGGTVVGKKEHKLTPAQKQALGSIRDLGPSASVKLHPATKKVLAREGYIDEHGKLTDKGRRAMNMPGENPKKPDAPEPKKPEPEAPKPEPKKPEAPEPKKPEPKKQQSLVAKHKLTQNQKDEIKALSRYGPVNLDLMGKQTRQSLERKGLIDSKGELTDEGKAVAKELIDAEPKPLTPPPPPPKPARPKVRYGHWANRNSPRPVPDFPKPEKENPDLEGKLRPLVMTRRERELHDLREQLELTERNGDEWTKGWKESLEKAKKEGGDVAYYEAMVKASEERLGDIKARIAVTEKAPKEPYWDTPEEQSRRFTGTPTAEQLDAHVRKIVKNGVPTILRPQVEGQLRHQGDIAPRSIATLDLVDIPSGEESLYHTDPEGYKTTLAYYQAAYRRIHISPRWENDAPTTASVVERDGHQGWFHLTEDGTTPLETILAHEVGHHVAYRALANVRQKELLSAIIREFKLPASTPVEYNKIQDALKTYAHGVKHELSVYGASSIQELLAETWAEYTNGGKNLRPHVKRVGDLMRELAEDSDVRTF